MLAHPSSDAAAFRDYLFDKGLALGRVKRIFGSVRSIVNLVMQEHGIKGANGFAKTYMPEKDDSQDSLPVPQEKLIKLQQACAKADDEMRWLLAIISDTGMHLKESNGIGCLSSCTSSGIYMLENGLRPSIPCSAIAKLMMALIEPNTLLMDVTAKPLARRVSSSLPASDEAYSLIGLSPKASITTLALRWAARVKTKSLPSSFNLK